MKTYFKPLDLYYSEELDFSNEEYPVSGELLNELNTLYDTAIKGKASGYKRFVRAIKKFPSSPQLRHFMFVWYMERGEIEKADELNFQIVKRFPKYFSGKLNLALYYYTEEKPEKMVGILGKDFNLKTLYPNKEVFDISDVAGMLKASVIYFSSQEDFNKATKQLSLLEELVPYSDDFLIAKEVMEYNILKKTLLNDIEDIEEGELD